MIANDTTIKKSPNVWMLLLIKIKSSKVGPKILNVLFYLGINAVFRAFWNFLKVKK